MDMLETRKLSLSWEKYDEEVESTVDNFLFTTVGLLEQINVTRDRTDYLWYITRLDCNRIILLELICEFSWPLV